MPTTRFRHVRHLLKDGKAKIVGWRPFAIFIEMDGLKLIKHQLCFFASRKVIWNGISKIRVKK